MTYRPDAQRQEDAKRPEPLPILDQPQRSPPHLLTPLHRLCILPRRLGPADQQRRVLVQAQPYAQRSVRLELRRGLRDDPHEEGRKEVDRGREDSEEEEEFGRVEVMLGRLELWEVGEGGEEERGEADEGERD